MARDELVYLLHILDAINTVAEYLQGVNEEKFKATTFIAMLVTTLTTA